MVAECARTGMEVGRRATRRRPIRDGNGVAGCRSEGLGVQENPSHRAFRVSFCIATLNLISYSEDKGERKVNRFLRSGVK